MIVAKFKNEDYGIESQVAENSEGFSVILKDLDSGETLPTTFINGDMNEAIIKAESLVK